MMRIFTIGYEGATQSEVIAALRKARVERVIDVPPQFIGMLPYALTIVVLAVFAGRVRPPAASGQPYTKE